MAAFARRLAASGAHRSLLTAVNNKHVAVTVSHSKVMYRAAVPLSFNPSCRCYSESTMTDFEDEREFLLHFDIVKEVANQEVEKIYDLRNANQEHINKAEIAKAIKNLQRFEGDTGSTEVQIAVMTARIQYLTEHMKKHRKDLHSRRGLLQLVQKRRKLLKYLKTKDLEMYERILTELKIRRANS